ncbi:hypothetical protein C8Q80DRAFT_1320490 [Daedaleopsis nitida]|nr:hypothetical protein C8Q80DRAFT_1320490 [Daedaleopsis nitida]
MTITSQVVPTSQTMSSSISAPRPLLSILRNPSDTSLTSPRVQVFATTRSNAISSTTHVPQPLTTQTNYTDAPTSITTEGRDDAPAPSAPSPPPSPPLPPPPPPPTPTGIRVRFAREPLTISARRRTRALQTLKPNGFLRPRRRSRDGHRVGAYEWDLYGREAAAEWPRPGDWEVDPTTVRPLQDLQSAVASENWWTWGDGCEVDDRTRRGRMMAPEFYSFE